MPPRIAQSKQVIAAARRKTRDLMESVAEDIARLPGPVIRDLMPALHLAERETAAALQRWLDTVENGADRFTAHHYRQVLLQLRSSIEAGRRKIGTHPQWVAGIGRSVVASLKKGGKAAGELANKHLIQEVSVLDGVFQSGLTPINIKNAALLARGEKMLIPRYEKSAARYSGQVWDDLRRQFAIGVARNETIDQLTNRLRRMGGPKGLVNLGTRSEVIPEGLFRRYRHWGERVARTEVINAYNVNAQEALSSARKDGPGLMKRWDATLDLRVCIICRELHGTVVPVDDEFPGGYMHPPAHPNCRCASVAWHPSWKDDDAYVEKVLAERKQELAAKQAAREEAAEARRAARRR